jgi:hypothetical protein
MDLAPTFLELAGAEYPAGGTVQSMRGESINAFLSGASDAVHDENSLSPKLKSWVSRMEPS